MEADWEIEVGPDAPVIDGAWAGLVDLKRMPERVNEITEAADLPALSDALRRLNAPQSPAWTAKCDVWPAEKVDSDELDASAAEAASAIACYVDLLPASDRAWATLDDVSEWARQLVKALRGVPLRKCRADLVVRRAFLSTEQMELGVTAYLTACGMDETDARHALGQGLRALVDAVGGL